MHMGSFDDPYCHSPLRSRSKSHGPVTGGGGDLVPLREVGVGNSDDMSSEPMRSLRQAYLQSFDYEFMVSIP